MVSKAPLDFLKYRISKKRTPQRGNDSNDSSQERGQGRSGMAGNTLEQLKAQLQSMENFSSLSTPSQQPGITRLPTSSPPFPHACQRASQPMDNLLCVPTGPGKKGRPSQISLKKKCYGALSMIYHCANCPTCNLT